MGSPTVPLRMEQVIQMGREAICRDLRHHPAKAGPGDSGAQRIRLDAGYQIALLGRGGGYGKPD